MSYNTTHPKYKSSYLAALDCTATGMIKGRRVSQSDVRYFATFTAPAGIEPGQCIAMVRVPAGTTVIGGRVTFSTLGQDVAIALGDPFACGRLTSALNGTGASGYQSVNTCGFDQNVIMKTGVTGDGCGIGYTYTCETDVCVTVLYGSNSANQGGWAGGTGPNSLGPLSQPGGGSISSGATIAVVLDVLPV